MLRSWVQNFWISAPAHLPRNATHPHLNSHPCPIPFRLRSSAKKVPLFRRLGRRKDKELDPEAGRPNSV